MSGLAVGQSSNKLTPQLRQVRLGGVWSEDAIDVHVRVSYGLLMKPAATSYVMFAALSPTQREEPKGKE